MGGGLFRIVVMRSRGRGFGLVEVVVGAAIIAGLVVGGASALARLTRTAQVTWQESRASWWLEEGAEAVRWWRDAAWANVSDLQPGTRYYLTWSGSNFATSTTATPLNPIFTRWLETAEVYRDGNGDVVSSGGTLDPETRFITLAVEWSDFTGGLRTKNLSFYLTNLFDS